MLLTLLQSRNNVPPPPVTITQVAAGGGLPGFIPGGWADRRMVDMEDEDLIELLAMVLPLIEQERH